MMMNNDEISSISSISSIKRMKASLDKSTDMVKKYQTTAIEAETILVKSELRHHVGVSAIKIESAILHKEANMLSEFAKNLKQSSQ